MFIQLFCAFFAVASFATLIEVPRRYVACSAATGGVGWCVYQLILQMGYSSMAAAFLSTLVIAMLGQILARVVKAPVTVFVVSGILPAVPGAAIYRSVYYLIRSETSLSVHYLMETLQIAGAIAMAIFIVDSAFRLLQYYQEKGAMRS